MWLSKRIMYEIPEPDSATLGTVSMGGENAAVVTDTEKRDAKVISPGGYCWQPSASESVLVIKGNELYVPGKLQEQARSVAPGEVMIYSQNAQITLRNNGDIEIRGDLKVSGDVRIDGDLHVTGKITGVI